MDKKLLLFGFDSLLSVLALESAVAAFGAEVIPVARTDYNRPMAVLAGLDEPSGPVQPYAGGPLGGKMVVLCDLDRDLDELLPALSRAGAGPECLKAVLTPHNRGWNAVMLYTELLRERRSLGKG